MTSNEPFESWTLHVSQMSMSSAGVLGVSKPCPGIVSSRHQLTLSKPEIWVRAIQAKHIVQDIFDCPAVLKAD
jgi:hypothetical protein